MPDTPTPLALLPSTGCSGSPAVHRRHRRLIPVADRYSARPPSPFSFPLHESPLSPVLLLLRTSTEHHLCRRSSAAQIATYCRLTTPSALSLVLALLGLKGKRFRNIHSSDKPEGSKK